MKKILLTFTACTLTLLAFAQIDQVSVGAAYTSQAYYKISTGDVSTVANESWDIAFSNDGFQDAGAFINESTSLMGFPLEVYVAPTNVFSDIIDNTDDFIEENRIHNVDIDWTNGAFNSIGSSADPFDYGWGRYNTMTNTVESQSVYVIKLRDESFIKFEITELAVTDYHFRWADLDGSDEKSASVSKTSTTDPLIYFSLESEATVDVPSVYDLVFQRYTSKVFDVDSGDTLQYVVTGVLSAPGVKAVVADGIDPDNVNEDDYSDQYSDKVNTIGHEWKVFDFTVGWLMDLDRAQFVRTASNDIYKIVFLDFEGSATGITTLEKTFLGTVAVDEEFQKSLTMFPNPTSDFIQIQMESNSPIRLTWISDNGQSLLQETATTNEMIKVPSNLSNGLYLLQVQEGESNAIFKVHIQR